MTDNTSSTSLLNEIWALYRRAGITDDLRIIESLAALLLKQEGIPLDAELPREAKTTELPEDTIQQKLKKATASAGDAGTLFDRYILFRLSEMRAGGRYPTPRHIAAFMAAVTDTRGKQVADFACGSGGMLVHSKGKKLAGIEISPEWARIARANLLLHGLVGDIETGNALRVLKGSEEKYARILMNPPFGAKVQSELGARSETALTSLAINHLEEDGRAAILVPTGLLFTGSRAEHELRQRLVDEVTLEAIITLPEDAFQPYSTLTTHLLLVQNTPPDENVFTWFLRPVYDGYPGGRSRDLTRKPQTPNDLTLIELAVTALRKKVSESPNQPFVVQPLPKDNNLLGVLLCLGEGVTLLNVRYLPAGGKNEPALLLAEVQQQGQPTFWEVPLTASFEARKLESGKKAEQLICQRLGLAKEERTSQEDKHPEEDKTCKDKIPKDKIPTPDVFQNQNVHGGQSNVQRVGGILVKVYGDEKPQLMGVAIPRETLIARDYALQPDDYLRAPEISAALQRPYDVLLKIRESQSQLSRRMERLAGWLVPERPKKNTIPAPEPDEQPFGKLSETQQEIWDWVAAQKDENGLAKPFTVQEIDVNCGQDEKRLSLDIFEAMGLIVPITLKNPQNEQSMNFYRLAEDRDKWTGPPEETVGDEVEES